MVKQRCWSIVKQLQTTWLNSSFRKKLTLVFMATAIVPTGVTSFILIDITETQLLERIQQSVEKELTVFKQQQKQVETNHVLLASSLAKGMEATETNLNDTLKIHQQLERLDVLMQSSAKAGFTPSFYLITDTQGRTVAQKIQAIADPPEISEALPVIDEPVRVPTYRSVSVPVGMDLSKVSIVQATLRNQQPLSGYEILSSEVLQKLGLAEQASIGIRPQETEGLSDSKKPLPEGTYPVEQGKIGIAAISVMPIFKEDQLIGTAIVGTLLNRNTVLIDSLLKETGNSIATLFAYDWRISTNIPTPDRKRRAIGTRVARQVAEVVLQQGKSFIGTTDIIGQTYVAAYAPLYDHRAQLSPTHAKPVGILVTAKPMIKVDETVEQLLAVSYGISAVILIVIALLALPLANLLSGSLQRLTAFAQQAGSAENDIDTSLLMQFQHRQDEIGILGRELHHMTQRIQANLKTVQRSEAQLREQTLQLQDALEQLQQAQLQLIQTEKMSSLGQLTAGIAHEINNPVSFIHGNLGYAIAYMQDLLQVLHLYQKEHPQPSTELSELIEATDLTFVEADLPNLLNSMKNGTQRIRDIVLSLRSFSRLDEAEMKVVDLHTGLESALIILQSRLQSSNPEQSIQVIRQYGNLPQIECHAGLLNQVFMNILTNAIDALETGTTSPRTIMVTTELENSETIAIKIADNGIGMCEAVKSKIFDPFYTTKPVGKGAGLGLSVSYQVIVAKHAGQLRCHSKPGEGTEFWISLPIVPIKQAVA